MLVRVDHFQALQNDIGLIESEELLLTLSNRFHGILRPDDLLIPSSHLTL